ncbi:barstar family protein [Streptomyces shenzhenensis]|uniref:barstar family protein n=1 Tax=Streptomyces shenzhenensis TaxID=943815 RepID=UPI00382B38EB
MGAPRYAVMVYDDAGETQETVALCADAEDLCADEPELDRGTYQLLGCAPEGGFAATLADARATGSAPVGPLVLEVLDRRGAGFGWCYLYDVRVLDDRPCARDLSLRDVTIEASVDEEDRIVPHPRPLSAGYRLLGQDGRLDGREEPLGTCKDVVTPFDGSAGPRESPPVRLLGCAATGTLRTAIEAGKEDLGPAELVRLDGSGRPIQVATDGDLVAWAPAARGHGLVDLVLAPRSRRPPTVAPQVWRLWEDGRPSEPNAWAACSAEGRAYWLTTALHQHGRGPDRSPGTAYHLDGRFVTDAPGFFCALGEAVNGTGGYFGWGLDATADALCGGFGAAWPFTLVWHDSDIARTCLGPTPLLRGPVTFEGLVQFLTGKGIEVRLD